MIPGRYPPNFSSLTFEIKSGMPIPLVRRNQRHECFLPQQGVIRYPIHNPKSKTYNLFTTLDKMAIGNHIEIKGFNDYAYAMTVGQAYACKLRGFKNDPVQMYLRGEWCKQQQIGRIWRMG